MNHYMWEFLGLKLFAQNMEMNFDLLSSNYFDALKTEFYDTCSQGLTIHFPNLVQNMLKLQLCKDLIELF